MNMRDLSTLVAKSDEADGRAGILGYVEVIGASKARSQHAPDRNVHRQESGKKQGLTKQH